MRSLHDVSIRHEFGRFVYMARVPLNVEGPETAFVGESAYRSAEVCRTVSRVMPLVSLAEALAHIRMHDQAPTVEPRSPAPQLPIASSNEATLAPRDRTELVGVFLLLVAVGGAIISTELWVDLVATCVGASVIVLAAQEWRARTHATSPLPLPAPGPPPPSYPPPPSPPATFHPSALLYDLDNPAIRDRAALAHGVLDALRSAATCWLVTRSTQSSDPRQSADSGPVVDRVGALVVAWAPVRTNVTAPCIQTEAMRLVFLPDAMAVVTLESTSVIPYEDLSVSFETRDVAEEGLLPYDVSQSHATSRAVPRGGVPDMRPGLNRATPWQQVGEVMLRSTSGWEVAIQVSPSAPARQAAEALDGLCNLSLPLSMGVPVATITSAAPIAAAPYTESWPEPPALSGSEPLSAWPSVPDVDAPLAHSPPLEHTLIVLKAVALADRRFTPEEVIEVRNAARALCPRTTRAIADAALDAGVRSLNADARALRDALQVLATVDRSWREELVMRVRAIAGADGKVTPKERERLAQIEASLGMRGSIA